MRTSFNNSIRLFAFLAVSALLSLPSTLRADIIDLDVTRVPLFVEEFKVAEAFWESRIQEYSTELPPAVLTRLSKLVIVCRISGDDEGVYGVTDDLGGIDGPGDTLAQAGPDRVVSFQSRNIFTTRLYTLPTQSTITLDFPDVALMIASGTLQATITHEMGHALGFGSLWDQNNLTSALNGVGLTQYTGGRYAIQEYRKEIRNPVVYHIPLEQTGGAGTAGGHWTSLSTFFVQPGVTELMTGFSDGQPNFVSQTTWGSLADLGYEVRGINDNTFNAVNPTPTLGSWPKTTPIGSNINNADLPDNPTGLVGNVSIRNVRIRAVTRLPISNDGEASDELNTTDESDPYRLRNQRWVK